MMPRFSRPFRRACITCGAVAVFLLFAMFEGDLYGFDGISTFFCLHIYISRTGRDGDSVYFAPLWRSLLESIVIAKRPIPIHFSAPEEKKYTSDIDII
jgi:hypothetical protein